jgi:hypothetical protein
MIRLHSVTARFILIPAAVLALTSASAPAQTPIERHSNRFTPAQDVELGRRAAAEIRRQLPMLNDERTEDFVERIGERLIDEIPGEFRQPEFRYTFDVVNLREINAFALPGGPMFVNRGMIQAARSEGEVAGVMAHELAHVVLRHGTVQATRGQKFQVGAMLGQVLGSILGGRTGAIVAQGSEIGLGTWFLKYSREFEREADLFGAQLMARAGYDPRQMARMFETIERQSGGRAPEWMSSHPNPGNRVQAINREAEMLQVNRSAGSIGDLQEIRAHLDRMTPAPSAGQAANSRAGRERRGQTSAGVRVDPPSGRWETHQPADFVRLSVPQNWEPSGGGGGAVRYAPEGGHIRAQNGQSVFTHGIEVGVARGSGGSLRTETDRLLQNFAESNPQLRRQGGYRQTSIDGRQGLTATLSNVSELTGRTEAVNLSTVRLSDGSLLFLLGVSPANEARTYFDTFSRVRQSVQFVDRYAVAGGCPAWASPPAPLSTRRAPTAAPVRSPRDGTDASPTEISVRPHRVIKSSLAPIGGHLSSLRLDVTNPGTIISPTASAVPDRASLSPRRPGASHTIAAVSRPDRRPDGLAGHGGVLYRLALVPGSGLRAGVHPVADRAVAGDSVDRARSLRGPRRESAAGLARAAAAAVHDCDRGGSADDHGESRWGQADRDDGGGTRRPARRPVRRVTLGQVAVLPLRHAVRAG